MRTLLLATLLVQTLLVASLFLSRAWPRHRVWPPPTARSWQFWFTWLGFAASVAGTLVVGVLGWGSLAIPFSVRFVVGPVLISAGLVLGLLSVRQLSAHASLGLGRELVRVGPYRYTRNPQYVADIALFLGWALLAASVPGLLTSFAGSLWFAIAPFVEEPWLREKYGEAYDSYCREVPRFLGVSSAEHTAAT